MFLRVITSHITFVLVNQYYHANFETFLRSSAALHFAVHPRETSTRTHSCVPGRGGTFPFYARACRFTIHEETLRIAFSLFESVERYPADHRWKPCQRDFSSGSQPRWRVFGRPKQLCEFRGRWIPRFCRAYILLETIRPSWLSLIRQVQATRG